MTKTLTEQFMNNELDDRLYYFTQKMSQDNVEIGHSFEFNMVRADDGEYLNWFLIHEVLAPVPSYDEYQRLVSNSDESVQKIHILNEQNTKQYNELCEEIKKNNILEKKLEIATKALKEYAEEGNWCDCSDWNDMVYQNDLVRCCENGMFGKDGFKPAQKALKEMEGVK